MLHVFALNCGSRISHLVDDFPGDVGKIDGYARIEPCRNKDDGGRHRALGHDPGLRVPAQDMVDEGIAYLVAQLVRDGLL